MDFANLSPRGDRWQRNRQQALDALKKRQTAKTQVHAMLAVEAAMKDMAKATREQTFTMVKLWDVEPK